VVHDSIRNLRFDKRLLRRRGWLSPDELERVLAELPDAAEQAEWTQVEEPRPAPAAPREQES
jgi:hypothetical protein